MSSRPPVKLSVLRDIGWSKWDPIGLTSIEGGWKGSNAADEYDKYLLEVAGRLRNGDKATAVVDFLVYIETEYMGLTPTPEAQTRAEATVAAVQEYIASID
jgi:hypothetical protein